MTDIETVRQEAKRDRFGRYLITPPDGGKRQAYTRATTIAETLDDRYNLEAWKVRMTALGIVSRPDLYAAIASTPTDDKGALNRLCDQAREAAAGSAGANLGTALHRFTERINRGEQLTVPPPWDADIAAYLETLTVHELDIDARFLERIVVLHEYKIAGTFDLLLNGHIADLKTGQTLDYSWPAIAMQLAIYAHADNLYNPDDDTQEPMPPVNQETAYVIHLPAGKAECSIHEVDLVAGWEAVQRALWVRDWRKRRNLTQPYKIVGGDSQVGEKTDAPLLRPAATAPTGNLDKLRNRYSKLDHDKKLWIDHHIRPDHTEYELGLMFIRYAELDADDELLRAAYKTAVGKLAVRKPVKDAITEANPEQIGRLSQLAVDIHNGAYTVTYTVDGCMIQPTERASV
jgi:hypothetical protein